MATEISDLIEKEHKLGHRMSGEAVEDTYWILVRHFPELKDKEAKK